MVRNAAAACAVALALAACSRGAGTGSGPARPAFAHEGRPAPPWSEPSVPGPSLSLASLRGKPIYLNFFATWCPPCNAEAPEIDGIRRKFAAQGLQVVGVDVLENARKAAQFRTGHHLGYPVVVDDGTLRDQYAVNGLPVHVFIDRSGVVRTIVVGQLSANAMTDHVERLLR